jgi:hypothetical protein
MRTVLSKGMNRLGASLPENRHKANCFFKKLEDGESQKGRMCQLTSVMLCSLFGFTDH